MRFRSIALAGLLVSLFSGSAGALEVKQYVDFQGGWGYGTLQNAPGSQGVMGHLLYVPLVKLSKEVYFTPLFFIDRKGMSPRVLEDSFSIASTVFQFKPAVKYMNGKGDELSVYGIAKRVVDKDADDQAWTAGFYDYEEFGGGWTLQKTRLMGLPSWGLGLGVNHRSYMNYHNLSANAPISLSYNYYVKDMLIPKIDLDATLAASEKGTIKAGYSLALRQYTDAYLYTMGKGSEVDPTRKRVDYYHTLEIKASGGGKKLAHSLGFEADYNDSNQNYFDAFNAQFFGDFYSFYSYSLKPELSWLIQGKPDGHRISLSYELVLRNYVHRNIRNSGSDIAMGAQADVENNFTLGGTFAITRWLSFYANGAYNIVRSNQVYEPTVKFSYDLFQAQAGLGLHY